MKNLKEEMLTDDIKSAMTFASVSKWLKITLAIVVILAYVTDSTWVTEVLVASVVVSLIFPLGFFDVFIQKLLGYNTQKIAERQILNSAEANEHFEKLNKKVGR
ncbi:hypothetical protein ACQUQP_14335 [Marinobacterium sp. YM272]|uniref:hypothetical protein n=1 Tax=Marinobacterium sp. YM272 TaxID=3421654 RepID=UPI003D7FFC8A